MPRTPRPVRTLLAAAATVLACSTLTACRNDPVTAQVISVRPIAAGTVYATSHRREAYAGGGVWVTECDNSHLPAGNLVTLHLSADAGYDNGLAVNVFAAGDTVTLFVPTDDSYLKALHHVQTGEQVNGLTAADMASYVESEQDIATFGVGCP